MKEDSKMFSNFYRVSIVVFMFMFLLSCATTQRGKKTTEMYVPKFSWTPSTTSEIGSADVTIAIVSPEYETEDQSNPIMVTSSGNQPISLYQYPLFKNFSEAIGRSFEELLTSKGFTIKGPFSNYDEMTYPEKEGSDLVIYPTINISVDNSRLESISEYKFILIGDSYYAYHYEGDIVLGGQISIVAMEPLSKEKMWIKNIDLDRKTVTTKGEKEYPYQAPQMLDFTDPGIVNPLAKAMESYFPKIMNTASDYINVTEMQMIKKKAMEVRERKVY